VKRARVVAAALGLLGLAPSLLSAQRSSALSRGALGAKSHGPVVADDSLLPYRPGVDVSHYGFEIRLPRTGNSIEGRATIEVGRRPSIDSLVLDLVGLQVDSVQVGAVVRPFVRDSATVRIPLRAADGAALRVTVAYHGAPSDGLIIREDSARGWSAFGDNWPNRARYWLPTVDHPSDKASVSWTVIAPSALAVVANGVQQARTTLPDGLTQTTYVLVQPIPTYLMVIAAAHMVSTPLGKTCVGGEGARCIPQAVWTFPDQQSYVPGPFLEAPRILKFFSGLGGSFAYPLLNHLQSSTRFGGMENATAIFYSDDAFRRRAVGTQLIAHETAHQWFGDAVTPRRWQDVWLSEGFASYWAPLYLREVSGDSTFRVRMREIRDEILAAAVVAARPVVDTVGALMPNSLLNANSYQKGAWVLHMLRTELGDSVFFGAMRTYQRTYRNSTATTDNLRVILERRGGASLESFFAQWLHRPGVPGLRVAYAYDPAKRTMTFTVTQDDTRAPFAVPLVVAIRDATGQEERHTVHVTAAHEQRVVLALSSIAGPTTVLLDPDVQLLARLSLERVTP
jgi:aminopeptidase N